MVAAYIRYKLVVVQIRARYFIEKHFCKRNCLIVLVMYSTAYLRLVREGVLEAAITILANMI